MAVTLPTLTVTDAQGSRILDAYKAKFKTTTTAETVTAYRRWLAREIVAVVVNFEAHTIEEANNVTKRDALAALQASLPDPATVT